MKRYSMLGAALALVLGSAVAFAGDPAADQYQTQPKTTTTTTTTATDSTAQEKNIQSVDLLFETDSAVLSANAHAQLEQLAIWGKCTPKGAVILEGHADPRGTQDHNMKLSAERAAVVRRKLVDMGVPSDRIIVTVYGENGLRRGSFAEQRRVTARAASRPLNPSDIVATK